MNSEQSPHEELLWITACYVAEVRAGLQPSLSTYVARYPQYAEEIADFVAYYHAIETELEQQAEEHKPSVSFPDRLAALASLEQLAYRKRVAEQQQDYVSESLQGTSHSVAGTGELMEQSFSIQKDEDLC